MTAIIQAAHKIEVNFHDTIVEFMERHPYIAFAAVSIGMPICVLALVFAGTAALILPFLLSSVYI